MSIIQPTGIFNTSLILVLVHSSCLAKGKYIYLYVIPSSRADLMLQVGWIYTKKCSIFVHSIWVLIMCLCEDAIIGYRYSKRLVFYCRCFINKDWSGKESSRSHKVFAGYYLYVIPCTRSA